MTRGTIKVREHMVSPVRVVRETDSLTHADHELSTWGISAVPVVDGAGCMVGVLSRTDLLRAGRMRVIKNGHRRRVLTLPSASAGELMTAMVEVVPPDTSLPEAAGRMLRHHIHRLYVAQDRRPIGVVSTKEMTQVVIQERMALPLSELMQSSLVSLKSDEPLSLAIDRMALSNHRAVIVLDDGWPLGVFTQDDALAARDAPPDERVDRWMDPAVICLPLSIPAFRAAEQLIATQARCVLAVDGQRVRGIVTGIDFTRLVKESPSAAYKW